MSGDLKRAVAERLAEKKKEEEKRFLEEESKKTTQETPYGLFAVREGVYRTKLSDSESSPPLKFVASKIPNFPKFLETGKVERVAGRKLRRSRKSKNKKNRSTRRRK
jgi:hypothetical protein